MRRRTGLTFLKYPRNLFVRTCTLEEVSFMRRGLKAIEGTGADPECCSATRAPRSVGMFDMNSGRSLRMPPGRKHIVDRVTLASDLIDEAMRLYGNNITFHFERQLQVPPITNSFANLALCSGSSVRSQSTWTNLLSTLLNASTWHMHQKQSW